MRASHRVGPVIGFGLILVMTACGAGQSTSSGPDPSAGPDGDPFAAMLAAELSLRHEIRSQAGLANIGPGAEEAAALMDKSESVALNALHANQVGATAQSVDAVLADVPTAGQSITGPVTILSSGFGTAMEQGIGTRVVDDRAIPSNACVPGYGTCSAGPGDDSQKGSKTTTEHGCSVANCQGIASENVTVAGNPGLLFTETTMTVGYDGSSISMDIEIKTFANVSDATTHATIYRIESAGKGHISGDPCPDASGNAKLHIEFSASENYFVESSERGRAGYGLEQSYLADVKVKADDNANLAGIDMAVNSHAVGKGGARAAGASQSELFTFSNDMPGTQTFGYDPKKGFTKGADTRQATSTGGLSFLLLGMDLYTETTAKAAAKATEKAWQSGMCIQVHASPNGGSVAQNSVTPVTVSVKQRYEGTDLDKPVEAIFSGVASLTPTGQKQPAPATFTYTAGPKDGDKGSATFTSTSNRGIGHTDVVFTVGAPPGLIFDAVLTATQTDHQATRSNIIITGTDHSCGYGGPESGSADQTFNLRSQTVRVDAIVLSVAPVGWGSQSVVLAAHGQPFQTVELNALFGTGQPVTQDAMNAALGLPSKSGPAKAIHPIIGALDAYPGLDQGSFADAPIAFELPSTVNMDRQYHKPGVPPLPADVADEEVMCLGGGPEGGPASSLTCGAEQYDLMVVIQIPQPNKVSPGVAPSEDISGLYPNCVSMADAPLGLYGCTACTQQVTVTGGDFPAADILNPSKAKIEIHGTTTYRDPVQGVLNNSDLTWTLTLCRVVNNQSSC